MVSLARCWIFARPAAEDVVWVDEQWEDDILASPDILHHPNHELEVRRLLGLGEDWILIFHEDVIGVWTATEDARSQHPQDPFRHRPRVPGIHMDGWNLADSDEASRAFDEAFAAIQGRGIDRAALLSARQRMEALAAFTDHQERGRQFDPLVEDILRAHQCVVECGRYREGEQIDVFVHRPFRALVECRWEDEPVGRPAISELIQKLMRERPAIVAGIYVSMSGFTQPAALEAASHARDRAVVLFDAADVQALLTGVMHVVDLFNRRIDDLVRRY